MRSCRAVSRCPNMVTTLPSVCITSRIVPNKCIVSNACLTLGYHPLRPPCLTGPKLWYFGMMDKALDSHGKYTDLPMPRYPCNLNNWAPFEGCGVDVQLATQFTVHKRLLRGTEIVRNRWLETLRPRTAWVPSFPAIWNAALALGTRPRPIIPQIRAAALILRKK